MGKGKQRWTARELNRNSDTVILQRTVYISGQAREEGICVQPNSNILENIHRDLISENRVERVFNFNNKKWEFFPQYNTTGLYENVYSLGWNGLRKLFPWIDRDMNVECRVTVIFNDSETNYWNKDFEIERYEKDDNLYTFHAESYFWCVSSGNGYKMLCKGEKNGLQYDTSKGWVEWDCCSRKDGSSFDMESPLYDIFPESKWDLVDIYNDDENLKSELVGVPLRVRVYVDADIDTNTNEI